MCEKRLSKKGVDRKGLIIHKYYKSIEYAERVVFQHNYLFKRTHNSFIYFTLLIRMIRIRSYARQIRACLAFWQNGSLSCNLLKIQNFSPRSRQLLFQVVLKPLCRFSRSFEDKTGTKMASLQCSFVPRKNKRLIW